MSFTEQTANFALWAVLSSPLILSHDIASSSPRCLALLTNPEVIAVNQAWGGSASFAVGRAGGFADGFAKCLRPAAEPASSTTTTTCAVVAVVFVNRGTSNSTITATWAELHLPAGAHGKSVRDVLAQKDRAAPAAAAAAYTTAVLAPNEAEFVRISLI